MHLTSPSTRSLPNFYLTLAIYRLKQLYFNG